MPIAKIIAPLHKVVTAKRFLVTKDHKAAIRGSDTVKGVFVQVGSLPGREPLKAAVKMFGCFCANGTIFHIFMVYFIRRKSEIDLNLTEAFYNGC